jgi:hypothetical protein
MSTTIRQGSPRWSWSASGDNELLGGAEAVGATGVCLMEAVFSHHNQTPLPTMGVTSPRPADPRSSLSVTAVAQSDARPKQWAPGSQTSTVPIVPRDNVNLNDLHRS